MWLENEPSNWRTNSQLARTVETLKTRTPNTSPTRPDYPIKGLQQHFVKDGPSSDISKYLKFPYPSSKSGENDIFEDVTLEKKTTDRTGESDRSPQPGAEDGALCEEKTGRHLELDQLTESDDDEIALCEEMAGRKLGCHQLTMPENCDNDPCDPSPRAWFGRFAESMKKFGYVQSNLDYTLFLKSHKDKLIALIIYVDDMIVTGDDYAEMQNLHKYLTSMLEMKSLGDLKYFLGIELSDLSMVSFCPK
ncbi:hypothetical protein L3X38_024414 [Prunus dulcis]|uniref:Reverse transcriptase Ty1/copia-type domain-containing protein n=1 Tax=Prunus dulcis TaxID=3755 RepID=A0AAD4Z6E4_PRUDU|nr:hypothetical protein L3X38_024414 [Prunus dulcis]